MEGKKGITNLQNMVYINNKVALVTYIEYNWNNAYEIKINSMKVIYIIAISCRMFWVKLHMFYSLEILVSCWDTNF